MSRARKIEVKLGGSPDITGWFPPRPKGMHWSKYELLHSEAEKASDKMWPPWLLKHMQLESQTRKGCFLTRVELTPHIGG